MLNVVPVILGRPADKTATLSPPYNLEERLTIKSQDINKLFLKKYINNSVNQKTA